jgi:hypothetical protein
MLFEDLPVFGGITQSSEESGFEPSHRVRERKDITLQLLAINDSLFSMGIR